MAGTAAPWREAHEERDGHRHGRGHRQESRATVKGPMLTGGEVRCPK